MAGVREDLPRQKQQTELKKYRKNHYYIHTEMDQILKIVLIVPDEYRGFIYINYYTTLAEGYEQLATDFLYKLENNLLPRVS